MNNIKSLQKNCTLLRVIKVNNNQYFVYYACMYVYYYYIIIP